MKTARLRKRNITVAAGIGLLAIGGIWLLYQWWVESKFTLMSDRGQYGDMFGGLNVIFSGLAFAALVVTVCLQSRELALQDRPSSDPARDEANCEGKRRRGQSPDPAD